LAKQFYNYILGTRFDPGAEAEVFERATEDPIQVFRGAARLAGSLNVFQHPQVWFTQQNGVQGIGGLQAGTVRFTPLIDPEQFEGP
jgi:hypothetical protein